MTIKKATMPKQQNMCSIEQKAKSKQHTKEEEKCLKRAPFETSSKENKATPQYVKITVVYNQYGKAESTAEQGHAIERTKERTILECKIAPKKEIKFPCICKAVGI